MVLGWNVRALPVESAVCGCHLIYESRDNGYQRLQSANVETEDKFYPTSKQNFDESGSSAGSSMIQLQELIETKQRKRWNKD